MQQSRLLARNAVRTWMRQVLADKGWSANEWAIAAKTSPTNITRMLTGMSETIPSFETIFKLARVAGSQPSFKVMGTVDAPPQTEHPKFCPQCGYDLALATRRPHAERHPHSPRAHAAKQVP